jgi:hypothetical protein
MPVGYCPPSGLPCAGTCSGFPDNSTNKKRMQPSKSSVYFTALLEGNFPAKAQLFRFSSSKYHDAQQDKWRKYERQTNYGRHFSFSKVKG